MFCLSKGLLQTNDFIDGIICVEVGNEIQQTLVAVLHQENTEETGMLNFKFLACSVSRFKTQPTSSIFFTVFVFTTIVLNIVFRFNYSSMEENLMDMIFLSHK